MKQTFRVHRAFVSMIGVVLMFAVLSAGASRAGSDENKRISLKPNVLKLLKVFNSEFVEITPGKGKFPKSFLMGSTDGPRNEQPRHQVTFQHNFSIAKNEVPQNLYEAIMGTNPSIWQGKGRERNSVEMLMWSDAIKFCREATKMMRQAELIKADEEIRLPTEAEWEYCCRAGTTTKYSFGNSATKPGDAGNKTSILDPYAWHTGNAAGNDPSVGMLKPNAWGLYDMHGYLWEYVLDAWHSNYDNAPGRGIGWDGSKTHVARVIRGGSWRDRFPLLESGTRWSIPDHVRSDAIGFRCVKATLTPGP
jgi:formylglycine-generating enzyme required for sulfatase activity